jgi:hypothetical protein
VNTYLTKQYQNPEAELLQARVLEQSGSGVEQSHIKYVLNVYVVMLLVFCDLPTLL